MGDESAYAWMDEAIEGKFVPADQREAYNPETILGRGSANIPVLNAANDAHFAFHHEPHRLPGIIAAWKRYFDCKGKLYHGQSEPYGCFRYCQWQTMSLVAMHGLAQRIGDSVLEDLCARWIRYRQFTFALSAGWWRYAGGSHPVAYAGARSFVGPSGDGGGRSVPWPGIAESGGSASDFSNCIGTRSEANWEVEPILQALERTMGYQRWNCISAAEVALMKNLARVKATMTPTQVSGLRELCGLIEDTGFVIHIGVHFFKTTEGVAIVFMKSHSSGSTSFKFGAVMMKDGRLATEAREAWYDNVDKQWLCLQEATLNRKSDPGGTGGFRVFTDRVEIECETKAGVAANGFEPGAGKHYEQWLGESRDPSAWPDGPRVMTLLGSLIAHYEIRQKQPKVTIHFPITGGTDPDPDPDPDPGGDMNFPGTKWAVRWVARTNELLKKHDGNVDKAKKDAGNDPEFQKAFEGHFDKWKQEAEE